MAADPANLTVEVLHDPAKVVSCTILRSPVAIVRAAALDQLGSVLQAQPMRNLRWLRGRVMSLAEGKPDGRVATAHPRLWLFQSTGPIGPNRVEARMVTVAVVLQGSKTVDFGDTQLSYDEGDLLLITGERKYVSHVERASRKTPYLSIALEFSPELVAEAALELADAGFDLDDEVEDAPAMVGRRTPEITDALGRLTASLDDPISLQTLAPLAERELILHLLRSSVGATLRRAVAVDDGRIERARAYLHERYAERVTIEQVARHVAMSPSHFAHRFRDIVRMSPMQYLKHLRLERARLLMLGDGLGAAEAAANVGYGSPSQFTREFKGRFGEPPAAYVRRFR